MDIGDAARCILLVILLLLSAFFSSAETALTTANKLRMRTLSEAGDPCAGRVLRITADSGKMLSAILIGNNIVNLSASSLATAMAIRYFGSAGAGIATGILTLLILIFGEVSPKTMATLRADRMAMRYAGVIEFLMKVLTPLIFVIDRLAMLFLRLLGVRPGERDTGVTEEEIRTIVDVGQESGAIEHAERDMIHNLFDFGDAEAKEVMVPRIDMTCIREDASFPEIMQIFREDKFTRLPVYEQDSEQVIGILNIKDLLFLDEPETFFVRDLMRKPYFTYEHKNTADLFLEMRKSSISLAIVLDEYGDTAGMITLEDLLEEIVGDIRDEFDADEEDEITRISDCKYLIRGSANLDDVNDALGIALSSEDYDTIGGYCLGRFDHLPQINETLHTEDGVLLRVHELENNRIKRLFVQLPKAPD